MCAAAHWQTRVGRMCGAAHSRLHDHLMNPVRPILCTSTEIILKTGHSSVLMSGLSTLLRPAVGPESLHGEVLVVVPSSSRDMPFMSSSSRAKLKRSRLAAMREAVTDFGMTTIPRSTPQRSTACAGVTPCFAAMSPTTSSSNSPPPRARGLYAVTATPRFWHHETSARCGSRGWISTWFTAGCTRAAAMSSAICPSSKLLTPMERTRPASTAASSARQHAARLAPPSVCINVPRRHTTGQWIRYRSKYSSCRSARLCCSAARTSSGRRRSFQSLEVMNSCSRVTVPLATAAVSAWPTSHSLAYAAAQSM
mmetsp:Transcript_28211/g.70811  ORF Transcript_28211/g.70811 Transcript_28211/m.70811 type:complete len:310 (-) Transcript_28211:292-1221(-)